MQGLSETDGVSVCLVASVRFSSLRSAAVLAVAEQAAVGEGSH